LGLNLESTQYINLINNQISKLHLPDIVTTTLVVGVMAFNVSLNTNSTEQQMSQTTLKNIEILAATSSENPCDSCDGNCCENWMCSACCEGGGSANCTLTSCQCI